MRRAITSRYLVPLLSAFLLSACASTRSVMEWQDEDYVAKLDNILVIAAVENETRRRAIEDAYVERLAGVSVDAIPGYTLIANDVTLSRETVEAAIAGQNLDAVLVTRLAGVEEVEQYQAPSGIEHYDSYHGYYAHARSFSSPGYYIKYKVLTLETNLYDTATQQLIWSMQSESVDSSAPQKVIDGQIELTVKRLLARGLLESGN